MGNKRLTPLHYAAWFNASEAVECLIQNGANAESSSAFGQKPLHCAVSRASVELVKVGICNCFREFRKCLKLLRF